MRLPSVRLALAASLLLLAGACGGGGGSAAPVVAVMPANPGVLPGASVDFTATVDGALGVPVTWSVQEGTAGGSIDSAGHYTAPFLPGSFHVVATTVASPAASGSTVVYVTGPAACVPSSPQPSALPVAQVLELGVHQVGETVTFTVPAGTGSVTLVQQGAEPLAPQTVTLNGTVYPNTVVPGTITVNGTTFYAQSAAPPADPSTWGGPNGIGSMFFEAAAPWAGTVTVPNTTNALDYVTANGGVPSGTWAVQVFDYAAGCSPPSCTIGDPATKYPPGKYGMNAFLKPGPVGAAGTVDVNVYLVTDRYTKASAEADPSMARMVSTLGAYLAGAGLSVGTATFVDVPASVKAQYASGLNVDDATACGEPAQVLSLAGPGNVLNLFLVNSLFSSTGPVGTTLIGLDGTIPGPASVGGTVSSGALVSIANLTTGAATGCAGGTSLTTCGADFTAYVAAHEAGHALGLYHDTEWTGTSFDPVKDTPTCLCSQCAVDKTTCDTGTQTASTYQMTNADCVRALVDASLPCGGGENLMFWLVSRTLSTGALTPQQARIMRANPVVR
jgi:hypothetical protein